MKILVLTSEAVSAQQLRSALPPDVDPGDAQVMVLALALHQSALRFWLSDADEAIDKAEAVRSQTLEQLGDAGVSASADTGESDPLDAVEDALRTFAADRIVVFAHPAGERRYREEIDAAEMSERFGVPVDQAEIAEDPAD